VVLDSSAKEEIQLIQKVQKKGDIAAADMLIKNYYDEILAYAYKQIGDKNSAMDLTQGIFISMLKTISRYDNKKAGFRTWLYAIATNKIIDFHRSRSVIRNKILDIDDVDISDDSDFVKQLENIDLAKRIQEFVATFDVDLQRIFRLKIFGGHTFAEIAIMLEISESTVKTKYYRLIKQVRKEFLDEYYT